MVPAEPDMKFTFGAVLGGAYLATALSGALCVQAFLYFRNYPRDPVHLKAMVALVWVMDTAQSCCIVMLTYQYVIFNFSRPEVADHIYWTAVVRHLAIKIN
jgi:cytochrome c biogenesis factor